MQATASIEVPQLPLKACSVEEHCLALRSIGKLPFWWYLGTSRIFQNFSVPFQDCNGHWWYQVKPGLCWAADCFRPLVESVRLPLSKSFHGYQHVTAAEQANSHLVINAVTDLSAYGPNSIDSKRRNLVRKGLRCCSLTVETEPDDATLDACRAAWDELTIRTGWKHAANKAKFDASWRLLAELPGVSILVGREVESGQVAGFLITKIIGDTAYVDTIASRTSLLKYNVNDALMYAFLCNARNLPGLAKAHYAIRSYAATLEKFKHGLGFSPVAFPARTSLHWPTRLALRCFLPGSYHRMHGQFGQDTANSDSSNHDSGDARCPKPQLSPSLGPDLAGSSPSVQLRLTYIETGRLRLGKMFILGLRDLLVTPFWWPIKMAPGVVTMKLRQWVYRCWLAEMGRHSLVEVGVDISQHRNIRIGDFTLIDKYCQLAAPVGQITIGARCHLAPFTVVLGHGGVIIDDFVGIGAGARILSISEWPGEGKRLAGPMVPQAKRGLKVGSVRLGRDCFIGSNAVVLPGVTVGEGAVVAANSLVGRDVQPWTVVMGVPAIPVGLREPVTSAEGSKPGHGR